MSSSESSEAARDFRYLGLCINVLEASQKHRKHWKPAAKTHNLSCFLSLVID